MIDEAVVTVLKSGEAEFDSLNEVPKSPEELVVNRSVTAKILVSGRLELVSADEISESVEALFVNSLVIKVLYPGQ